MPSLGGSSTITTQVYDVNGNVLPAAPVSFSTTAGMLSSTLAVTDTNGAAQVVPEHLDAGSRDGQRRSDRTRHAPRDRRRWWDDDTDDAHLDGYGFRECDGGSRRRADADDYTADKSQRRQPRRITVRRGRRDCQRQPASGRSPSIGATEHRTRIWAQSLVPRASPTSTLRLAPTPFRRPSRMRSGTSFLSRRR